MHRVTVEQAKAAKEAKAKAKPTSQLAIASTALRCSCDRITDRSFVSHAIPEWISQAGIATALSDLGKPWHNGPGESFNGKLRDKCLSLEWFRSRKEAAVIIEA